MERSSNPYQNREDIISVSDSTMIYNIQEDLPDTLSIDLTKVTTAINLDAVRIGDIFQNSLSSLLGIRNEKFPSTLEVK
jgi:hypothetical protein